MSNQTEQNIFPGYQSRGKAQTFEQNKYSTKGFIYPSDLMEETNNRYGGSYVIFYINIHEDSLLTKGGQNQRATVDSNLVSSPRNRGEINATEISGTAVSGAVTGAAALAVNKIDVAGKVGSGLGSALGLNTRDTTVTRGIKVAANTGIGAAAGAAVINAVGGPKADYKRQLRAIALHIPNDLSTRYGVQWEPANMALATIATAGIESFTRLFTGKSSGGIGGAAAGALAGQALQTPGIGELLQKTSGTATNPKREQLFKEVDFRTFTFQYQFSPRSPEEAQQVRDIIKEFKIHMHPEYRPDTGQFLYIYPSEFDIFYYQNGKENLNLHRHTSCVLTEMSVNYTPQGSYTTFQDGMPSQINIQLTFKELALLSKEAILDGF